MKIVYINCGGGVAGDIILAALFGFGFSPQELERKIKQSLPAVYQRWRLLVKDSEIQRLPVKKVKVIGKLHFKSPREMKNIILQSKFPSKVKKLGEKILNTLITAEAQVHRVKKKEVHFHEINSIDTLVDIIGGIYLLNELSPEKIICSAVNLGVPAPATLEIARIKNVPVFSNNSRHEMATPTGLAIVSNVVDNFSDLPRIKVLGAGYGAGNRKITPLPQPLVIIKGNIEKH